MSHSTDNWSFWSRVFPGSYETRANKQQIHKQLATDETKTAQKKHLRLNLRKKHISSFTYSTSSLEEMK